MTWGSGRERSYIPERIKRQVRRRDDNTCQLRYPCCTGEADEFDHIYSIKELGISRSDRRAVDPNNLRCVCIPCHRQRTQQQAQAGLARRSWRRKPRPHPGLLLAPDDSKR